MIKTAYVTPDWSRAVIGNLVYTRVEVIEEVKGKIDQLIETTRHLRDLNLLYGSAWLVLDVEIDRLHALKDTVHLPDYQPEADNARPE